ncbi:gamma-glutamylcyclotransferase [Empedobacter brevis]|uniref:Gamma-glutamylcyclotransferase n=1 Tax=Empedobacter brevis TaxID=247 RepID=A0AAJ1V7Y5_9FLAO|nr:gamma-glutamylcyclotransferase [Empedobacter brevis]MDM1071300.1 gamma-glutamylcyclotransferase [Empedobacter brevis]
MKIFTYGSNMNLDRLKERVPSANKLLNVFIKGYTIKYNKTSKDGSSKANIIETGNDSDIVWGVIFEIDDSEKANLDRAEGLGQGYNESILSFWDLENNPYKAQVYIADESSINEELLPYDWYKEYIVSGAKENGLPEEYIEKLEAINFIEDMDTERRDKNFNALKKTETHDTTENVRVQNTISTMNKGSEWRKWNFHVHTKGTNKNDQFSSPNMDEFFYVFFKKAIENGIEAIGITDYFSLDRYKDAVRYVSEIESKIDESTQQKLFTDVEILIIKKIFIFPNVELRMLPSTDRARLINIHCIFNPPYVQHLENDFFGHLSNQDGIKMNRHGLIEYGRGLDQNLPSDDLRYKKGVDNFTIDLKSLKELIANNKNFKENCIIIVSNSNNDGASAIQKHYDLFENEEGSLDGLRRSIYEISNCIFSTNPKDIKYFLGKRLEETEGYSDDIYNKEVEEVIKNRGSLKPCLVGCDSHKEHTLFSKFTWIKSDLTFEGLRQICFEPEQRVKIQASKPDFKEDKVVIEKVKFISPSKKFKNEEIYLNPNLNVIIGGKSSGKSILLFSIAKTLLPEQEILKNDNGEEKYNLLSLDSDFNFEVTTKAGFSQLLFRDQDENSIIPDIKYIPQNYLVKLAEPEINKKGKPLNKLVRDLINEDTDSKSKYNSFITNVKQLDKDREDKINKYFELLDEVEKLDTELKTKSNKEVLETNISSNTTKVEELNKEAGLNEEELIKYKELQEKENKNKERTEEFRSDFKSSIDYLNNFTEKVQELKALKVEFLSNLKGDKFSTYYNEKLSIIDEIENKLNQLKEEINVIKNNEGISVFANSNIFNTELEDIKSEKAKISGELTPFIRNEELQKQIKILNESIQNDKKLLAEIERLNKQITDKKSAIQTCKTEIFELYDKVYNEYQKVIEELKQRTTELEKDGLKIEGISQINFSKIYKSIYEISDGRKAHFRNYEKLVDFNKKSTDSFVYDEIKQELIKIFDSIMDGTYAVLPSINKKNAIKILLEDYFFDYWKITYKNDRLGEMSTGKASFVILMLIIGLSKSKSPILIDQPEDNLDNRSITRDLVNYLKNKKLERQIIVVTHNANIVVNADAENIIIANQKGQNDTESTSQYHFDYINGAIENTKPIDIAETDLLNSMGVREHIAEIVEGGKEAFILREKKYRFIKNIA